MSSCEVKSKENKNRDTLKEQVLLASSKALLGAAKRKLKYKMGGLHLIV